MRNTLEQFQISGRVCIITGGGGLMADSHARAVLSGGGVAVLLDVDSVKLEEEKARLEAAFESPQVELYTADITDKVQLELIRESLLKRYGRIDVLINNAANNPKVEGAGARLNQSRFECFPAAVWDDDIAVGLTGAMLCAQVFGSCMAERGKGVILNISSDLGIIAPDQRIYRRENVPEVEQNVKPVTYSVVKHGLIGLTKYLATYWAERGVRCNAICPAGIENGQSEEFIRKLTALVPMGRMAKKDEYQGTVLYLISDASEYMTGSTLVIDGGRTCW